VIGYVNRANSALVGTTAAFALTLLSFAAVPSHAEDPANYPSRTVTIICPSAAGGTTDVVARTIAQALSQSLAVNVIVEQKVGGNTNVGSAYVGRAAPDGYTLLINTDTLTSNASVYKQPGYDPIASFEPVTILARAPGALAIRRDLGVTTVEGFVQLAEVRGRRLTVASTGTGTVSHLTSIMFRQQMGLGEWTDVPYQGSAKAVTDLVGGHVDAIFSMIVPLVPHVVGGNLTLIAVTTKNRSDAAPGVPTIAEKTTLKDFDVVNWTALLAPAGTPKPIVEKLATNVAQALKQPEVAKKFSALGLEAGGDGPQELAVELRRDLAQWRDVVARAGLREN
jgi:tripartite-type tricarboxylate transporter receptor subunit TctC